VLNEQDAGSFAQLKFLYCEHPYYLGKTWHPCDLSRNDISNVSQHHTFIIYAYNLYILCNSTTRSTVYLNLHLTFKIYGLYLSIFSPEVAQASKINIKQRLFTFAYRTCSCWL